MISRSYTAIAAADNLRLEREQKWYRYAIDGVLFCPRCHAHTMADGKPEMCADMPFCPRCGFDGRQK